MSLYWKYRGAAHNVCNIRNKTPKKILVGFHNGSKYDYRRVIKEQAEEFEEKFKYLNKVRNIEMNTEKNLIMVKQLHTK